MVNEERLDNDEVAFEDSFDGHYLDLLSLPFGIRHRVLRALIGASIEDVAGGAGVNPYTVTRWEQHGVEPQGSNRTSLVDFYALFGVPAEVLGN